MFVSTTRMRKVMKHPETTVSFKDSYHDYGSLVATEVCLFVYIPKQPTRVEILRNSAARYVSAAKLALCVKRHKMMQALCAETLLDIKKH
jgi:hypothetical protein